MKSPPARAGWAEASEAIAAAGDDALVWPAFVNSGDEEWHWPLPPTS